MDPVLSSLLATNQIGSDGFNWWIGQVETGRTDDPKQSGRYRVRIVGVHLREGQKTPTAELPWANVVMPVTTPFSDGGVTGATAELRAGNWVIGFFLDNDRQKPIIMGSIGHTAGSTVVKNEDPQAGSPGPRNLTTHSDSNVKPQAHQSQDRAGGVDEKTGANVEGGETDAARSNIEKGAPAIIAALRAKHSETNPTGSANCVTIANPKCGSESNFDKQVTNIIGDLLAANQASGGQIGSFYVSKVNGFLYSKIAIARHHIGRVNRLVSSLMGRIQSEIIRNLREGVQNLVNLILGLNVPEEAERKVPKDPEGDHRAERKKGNFLKNAKRILDQILKALGCAIENLIERLVNWLTNLLFSFIMEVFSPAACAILNLVDGIVNKILELIDGLINSILGPLQSILGILASPLNMIGGAINKVMSFLGISCSGPDGNCSKETVKCNDCGTDEDENDFLDNLLNDIENGDTGERFSCEESQDYPDPKPTKVIFVGGIPGPDGQPDPDNEPDPEPPGDERPGSETPPGFFPDKPIDEILGCMIPEATNYNPSANIDDGSCEFAYEEYEPIVPEDFEDDPDDPDEDPPLPIDYDGTKRYGVVGEPRLVAGGDTITFTINTTNVADGSTLSYSLVGDIVEEYIDDSLRNIIADDLLKGTFTVTEYDTVEDQFVDENDELQDISIPLCRATVTVKLMPDIEIDVDQLFNFHLEDEDGNDTGARAPVTILADFAAVLPPSFEDPSYDPTTDLSISVRTDKKVYKEGEDIIFTIESEGFSEGRQFQYTMYGDVSAEDFIGDTLQGTFKLKNNTATVTVGIKDDGFIESDEVFFFKINDTNATCSATIERAEAFTPGDTDDDADDTVEKPAPTKPTADDVITGDDGEIISVVIKEPGDPYSEPPQVIFSGNGYGATGIALLDDKGFVSEIRVTRGGLGYKRNLPQTSNLRCIIDSFTMIAPGIRYTSAPDVFINGVRGGAVAKIDERGYVISVTIIDRKTSYTSTPSVKIIGGGGSGAIFRPSMVCLDTQDINTIGLVKIGTGRYVDCP